MSVRLVWATPNAEQLISDMARVSNPVNQGQPPGKLLAYCVRNQHWSIFEMASACFEIECPRDIARQILRHRSLSFQEFSQRYQSVDVLPSPALRELRLQDTKNRQNSISVEDVELSIWWQNAQADVLDQSRELYKRALAKGIAKEQARALLPEGLTTSRMYASGTVRSWMHYCKLRTEAGTQREHRDIAQAISDHMAELLPLSWAELQHGA
jgi:thymidylate synthase (FAD)